MKNSKGETLKQPYLDLALMRREKKPYDDAILGFVWNNTPEGYVFWSCVNRGETPAIFEFQLAELEEWRKAKHPYNEIAAYQEDTTEQPAEPDWKAMYEEMKADRDYYRHEYELKCMELESMELDDIDNKPTPTRNWLAECAMAVYSNSGINLHDGIRESWEFATKWAAEGVKRGHLPKTDNA